MSDHAYFVLEESYHSLSKSLKVLMRAFDGSAFPFVKSNSSGQLEVAVVSGGGSGGTEFDDGDAIDTSSQGTLLIATDGIPGTARALRSTAAGLLIVADGGGSLTVDGPLTDAELRAVPVPVSATNLDIRDLSSASDSVSAVQGTSPWVVGGTVAATQSGAWTVAVSGSVAVTGPLTDTQLRASPVPVTQTDSDLMRAKVEGPVAHDSPASNPPLQIGGIASAAAPTPVSADGDAVRVWIDRVGRLQVTIASVSGVISVDGSGVTQPVSIAGTVAVDTELPAAAAISDTLANPTTPQVAADLMNYFDNTGGTAKWMRNRSHYFQTTAGVSSGTVGTTVDMTACPMSMFAISFTKSGTVTSFNIALEGSIDNVTFVALLTTNSVTGADNLVFVISKPVAYMRFNATTVAGGGTETVTIMACPR